MEMTDYFFKILMDFSYFLSKIVILTYFLSKSVLRLFFNRNLKIDKNDPNYEFRN